MTKFLEELLAFFYQIVSKIRDKERAAETQLEINEKVKKADEIIQDLSLDKRDDILRGLHRRGRSRSTSRNKRD